MNQLTTTLNNEYVVIATALFIGLYGLNLAKVQLPTYISNLFKNTIFRIVFLSLLLVFRFENSPHVALTIALVFVLTLDYLGRRDTKENFDYLEHYRNQ